MATFLVTGGTGVLGSEVVSRLQAAGHTARIMSRHAKPDGAGARVEWAQASIEAGEGLAEACAGADAIVHCASSPFRRTREVDVEGTRRLLEAAKTASVAHFVYISIVGIDRVPLGYYKAKLAAERVIEESGVPYSILRAPQFHTLVDQLLGNLLRFPLGVYPAGFKFQPVDAGEVATRLVELVDAGPSGRAPDFAGPEVRSAGDLARAWLRARRRRALLLPLPLLGKTAAAYRAGHNCAPDNAYGKITWEQWLERKYGVAGA